MEWYYVIRGARQGPVDEASMRQLLAQGAIDAMTLVWNSQMTQWAPLSATSLAAAVCPPGHHKCVMTGRAFPENEMFQSEHGWVSAEAKDKYFESLRQGIAPGRDAIGTYTAWRDGSKMVIPVRDSLLPPRCVKTNVPVQADDMKRSTFYYAPGWIIVTILLSWVVTLILYFVMRKPVVIGLPLSPEARRRISIAKFSALGAVVIGFIGIIWGAVALESIPGLIIGGVVLLLGALIVGVRFGRSVSVASLKDGYAWLGGVNKEYLESLPPFR